MTPTYLSLGRFLPRQSPLHRLDAGVKLVSVVLLATAAVWSRSLLAQACVASLLLLGFAAARLPASVLLRALRGAAWLLLFVAAANLLWAVVVRSLEWASGVGAVQHASDLALLLTRLFNLVLLSVLFTATTVPVDVAEGLARVLRPLERLRLPVHDLGMLLVLSLSFVPIFFEEARHLTAAHRVKMGRVRWGWRDRMRAVVPLVVPLFLSVVRRGDELAVALDARCFRPGRPRTSLVRARIGVLEVTSLSASAAVLVAALWLL
ncbi:MAG: energy-coupling factor transporter transmembrane protein EcfT [Candidatus Latescibacterota bacterium]|nr:MAG: energy-coupling factor transporter transmembrane protein EcfT [Candidatus Latescibacterota bacterium]